MEKWFADDGTFLFKAAGTFAFQFKVDHGGTPTDSSDDVEIPGSFVELSDHGIDDTAGRHFCEDLETFTS